MSMVGRKDWIQADLRCLMCGRVLGRLVGPAPAGEAARRTVRGRPLRFAAFRPADESAPATRLQGSEHFRCSTCGGALLMDEVETFSTYGEIEDEHDGRPRRGRPPKPWRRASSEPSWMDELGIAG